jgi:hypothetical protein
MKDYPKDFNVWVQVVIQQYCKERKKKKIIAIYENDYSVVVDVRTGKTGMAKRHEDDTDDRMIGMSIAYARLRNIPIPSQRERMCLSDIPFETPFYVTDLTWCEGLTFYKAHQINNGITLCITPKNSEWEVVSFTSDRIVEVDY